MHISYEDQQKINKFARLNAKADDIKDELKVKHNDIKNLEEAVEELALSDESEKIPFLVGEVFICQSLEDTLVSKTLSKDFYTIHYFSLHDLTLIMIIGFNHTEQPKVLRLRYLF